jgi:hypothetical protein
VIIAPADRPQFFNERFPIPESRGHKAFSSNHPIASF